MRSSRWSAGICGPFHGNASKSFSDHREWKLDPVIVSTRIEIPSATAPDAANGRQSNDNPLCANLWVLLILFCLRVVGQMLVAFFGRVISSADGKWFSGFLAYPLSARFPVSDHRSLHQDLHRLHAWQRFS